MRPALVFVLAVVVACASPRHKSITDAFDCLIAPMTSGFRGGEDQIMVFARYCHGDPRMTTNISVLKIDSLPKGPGNILVLENPHATRREDVPIAIARFRGDSGIEVFVPLDARVVSSDSIVAGYHVRFSNAGPTANPTRLEATQR